MPTAGAWVKMAVTGTTLCIGGPALVWYVMPTEEELFKRYNPDLQRRSLENRHEKQQAFDDYVTRLKEASKSDKPIWAALDDLQERDRAEAKAKAAATRRMTAEDAERMRREMRASTQTP